MNTVARLLSYPERLPVRATVTGAFVVAAILHFGFITRHSLWNNDFITLTAINLDYPAMIAERVGQNHMPLYFIVLKAFTDIFGDSELALKLPAALFSFAGIVALWRCATDLLGARGGALVLWFAALNQIHVYSAHEARMYSWVFLDSALVLWLTILYLETGGTRRLVGIALVALCGLAIHLNFGMLILGIAAFLCLARRRYPRRWWRVLLALLAPLPVMMPLILWWSRLQYKIPTGQDAVWYLPQLGDALKVMVGVWLGDGGYLNVAEYMGRALALVALVIVGTIAWQTRHGAAAPRHSPLLPAGERIADSRRYVALLLAVIAVPVLAVALGSMRTRHDLVSNWRYQMTSAPAAALLLGISAQWIVARGRPMLARVFVALVLLVEAMTTVAFLIDPGQGTREAAGHLEARFERGDAVLAAEGRSRRRAFEYYADLGEISTFPESIATEQDGLVWLADNFGHAPRLWTIYFRDEGKDLLHRIVRNHPQYFVPEPPFFEYGDTRLESYLVQPALAGLATPTSDTQPPIPSAPM